jgi:RNA polymerase sigma factor (sigma-70 family)
MANSKTSRVIQHLRRAVLLRDGAGMTDGQLLDCFLSQRDDAAFGALVRRHGPMVWGVCRRVLHHHHDAEDAFQATFLVLVRKAASVEPKEMVANWLYGVAYQTALKARSVAARRKERERQVVEMSEPAVAEREGWHDLQPLLDQESRRLPDKYRVPLVLCDVEGKTRKEAARQLGWPDGTVAGRLATARRMLAKRLARHGLAVSGGALAAVLSQKAASVPASVVSSTIKAASLLAMGPAAATGVISIQVAALAEGVMKAVLMSKLKSVMAVTLAMVATVGIGAGLLGSGTVAGGKHENQKGDAVASPKDFAQSDKEGQPKKDAAEADKEKPQGTWVAVEAEAHGSRVPEEKARKAKVTLVVTGDKFTATASGAFSNEVGMKGDATLSATIKIEPSKQPGRFDLVDCRLNAGKLKDVKTSGAEGIYELKGNTLKVCYGPKRPTEFKTKPYSHEKLYVFEREKLPDEY